MTIFITPLLSILHNDNILLIIMIDNIPNVQMGSIYEYIHLFSINIADIHIRL